MSASEHPYHRSLAPMMWVFVGLASTELIVVHFLVALWDWRVALVLSLASLASVIWLIGTIRSFRRLPVVIAGDRLLLRAGSLKAIEVPLARIANIRTSWNGDEITGRDVRNLALIAYPNILIELRNPIELNGRSIQRVAHRFDDPAAFHAALEGAIKSAAQRAGIL